MLDDLNLLAQRDPQNALGVAASQPEQAAYAAEIINPDHDGRTITNIVVAGMGGSALAALLAKAWLGDEIDVPFVVVRDYRLPNYIGSSSLVIASSYSGNTEETIEALGQAHQVGAQVAIIASGGKLIDFGEANDISLIKLPSGIQPRMAMIYNLRALVRLLVHFGLVKPGRFSEIELASAWLQTEADNWRAEVTTDKNYAKQLALEAVGKTAVFYGGGYSAPVAYKWKISWNENAKNVAFWNQYPEFNHNEFMGWVSHPIDKPFAVFDLISSFEHPQTRKRFEISDRLLSGRRPKATTIQLSGDSLIKQLLWSSILADFVSIYLACLNGVNPTPVDLIEKLKAELA